MLLQAGVIPARLAELWGLSPRLVEAFARKESLACASCGAKLRARRMAETIRDLYGIDVPCPSLAAWSARPGSRTLRIAEINRIDGLHESIASLPNLRLSEFSQGAPAGSVVDGVAAEDLMRLSYDDRTFDLVLTSETLEHVPDLRRAIREIARILVPGGHHVFTVPQLPGVEKTISRSILEPDGAVTHLAAPIHHPGGDEGYPVFTEIGADFPAILEEAGFEVEIRFGPTSLDDVAQVYVCRKPVEEDRH
jgi:SAM-dependent methyltransferase